MTESREWDLEGCTGRITVHLLARTTAFLDRHLPPAHATDTR